MTESPGGPPPGLFCDNRFKWAQKFPRILGNLFLVRTPAFPIFYRQEISRPVFTPKLPENGIFSLAAGILQDGGQGRTKGRFYVEERIFTAGLLPGGHPGPVPEGVPPGGAGVSGEPGPDHRPASRV